MIRQEVQREGCSRKFFFMENRESREHEDTWIEEVIPHGKSVLSQETSHGPQTLGLGSTARKYTALSKREGEGVMVATDWRYGLCDGYSRLST